jgi:GH25 family lysozyme M1 (1,4-beta-N-acetylmuramidase)
MSHHDAGKEDKGGKRGGKDQSQDSAGTPAAPKGAAKNRARGPDWSHFDIEGADFQRVNRDPIGYKRGDFGLMKLTEGASGVDATAAEQWALVNQVEVRGAYHYQRSGQPWQAQADHFLNEIKERGFDFEIYALDLEGTGNTFDDTFFNDTRQIVDYLQKKAPGKMVMLYCNASTFEDKLYPAIKRLYPADGVQWLEKVPLWLARYMKDDQAGKGEPKPLKQRITWDIWQHDKNGARDNYGARDLNVFNGTKEDLKAWLEAGSPLIQSGIVSIEPTAS